MTNETIKTINVGKDFGYHLAGCKKGEVNCYDEPFDYNGESFRENHLIPALESADKVVVDVYDIITWTDAWMEEVFGGLERDGYDTSKIEISGSEPMVAEVERFITKAQKKAS